MKNYCLLLILVLCFPCSFLVAQTTIVGQGSQVPHSIQEKVHGQQIEEAYQLHMNERPLTKSTGSLKTIPVVFHVVQNSSTELLSDAEIYAQIEVLNEDFRKTAGTPGFGNGVDTEYQFCLAQIGPDGCPSTGINRIVAPNFADHDIADSTQFKALSQWNPFGYLNIWVPNSLYINVPNFTAVGYATTPQELLAHQSLDGIVITRSEVGRNVGALYNGRLGTRLAGIWLGLLETGTGGCTGNTASTCLSAGDRVCDTPQSTGNTSSCSFRNTCTDLPVDNPDPINNYMHSQNGFCWNMFTQGQKDRLDFMTSTLRPNLVSASNLSQTGCDGTQSSTCPPVASFLAPLTSGCVGQAINFEDLSPGTVSSRNWSFPGGSPSTSSLANPVVTYSSPGLYNITLEVGNSLGTDTTFRMDYISIRNAGPPPLSEGFEVGSPYPAEWHAEQSPDASPWTQVTGVSYSGNNCIKVDNLDQFPSEEYSSLYSRAIDITNAPGIQLSFQYAYKRFNSFQVDSMEVLVSVDCGNTWQRVWQANGFGIATVAGFTNQPWAPTSTSQWRQINLNLDSLAGTGFLQVQFKVISQRGQSLYLDDINILGVVSADEADPNDWHVQLSPNPVREQFRLGIHLPGFSPLRVTLFDLHGKAILIREIDEMTPGTHELTFDESEIRSLPLGTYLLEVQSNAGIHTQKLVRMD